MLYDEVGKEVRDVLRRLVVAKGGLGLLEGSVCGDFVQMCLRIAPKHSVVSVMGYQKGMSFLILLDHHPEWRSRTGPDRMLLTRGYYVSTVGINKAGIGTARGIMRMRAG